MIDEKYQYTLQKSSTSYVSWPTDEYITDWLQFAKVIRSKGCQLLKKLRNFPNAVLVTGCQRSGTTMLSRLITQSEGMSNYWFGPDDELDAALILSGYVNLEPNGRYCFQTTYINKCHHEYYEHQNGQKILWLVRNPYSIIYSMLYNWNDQGLDILFGLCGESMLTGIDSKLYKLIGIKGVNRLRRACWIYVGKTNQLFEMRQHLEPERMMVVDYDDLVTRKKIILPAIYKFIDLDYKQEYGDKIHSHSLSKVKKLTQQETSVVESLCEPIYQKAKSLVPNIEL